MIIFGDRYQEMSTVVASLDTGISKQKAIYMMLVDENRAFELASQFKYITFMYQHHLRDYKYNGPVH